MKYDYHKFSDEYNMFMRDLRTFGKIPGSTGGMTGFGGLFIYTVARTLNAKKILEVGTRNGVSAATFCRAMQENSGDGLLLSCDVLDVENGKARPGVGAEPFPLVPSKMIKAIGCGHIQTHFLHKTGADVLQQVPAKSLDIVLLDGSHKVDEVCVEIPRALSTLRTGGVLLLDDVYPNGEMLKGHNKVIHGPWQAIDRLIGEGAIDGFVQPDPGCSVAYIEK